MHHSTKNCSVKSKAIQVRHESAKEKKKCNFYSFLTSTLSGGEWSASHPGCAGLDTEARGKILCLCRGSNLGRPVCSQTLYWLSYPISPTWNCIKKKLVSSTAVAVWRRTLRATKRDVVCKLNSFLALASFLSLLLDQETILRKLQSWRGVKQEQGLKENWKTSSRVLEALFWDFHGCRAEKSVRLKLCNRDRLGFKLDTPRIRSRKVSVRENLKNQP
jgi:hypothetical protein